MYNLTKDGFTFLVMGYAGKEAAAFKEAYITRFNAMENSIKSLLSSKFDFPAFTESIMQAHDEPKHYHYSNEINLIYRIVLGMDAKAFRHIHGLQEGEGVRPYLQLSQIKAIETLQRIDIGLLETSVPYDKRKEILTQSYQKRVSRLAS
jgi:hypothetical protein